MNRKKLALRLLAALLGLSLTAAVAFVMYVAMLVADESAQLCDNAGTALDELHRYHKETAGFDSRNFAETVQIEAIGIPSAYEGHSIPAELLSRDGHDKRGTVILVHGLGGNRMDCYPEALLFMELGFNVLVYDQRSSGENQARYTSFGHLESLDLSSCVRYLRGRLGAEQRIGVWGTSFGGATCGMYAGTSEAARELSFAILDSPVGGMRPMLEASLRNENIPIPLGVLLTATNLASKLRYGFGFAEADTARRIASSDIPVLILQSAEDIVTPLSMAKTIYQAVPHQRKELVVFETGEHSMLSRSRQAEYRQALQAFLLATE